MVTNRTPEYNGQKRIIKYDGRPYKVSYEQDSNGYPINKEKSKDYLYVLDYVYPDYNFAKEYYKKQTEVDIGACTAVRYSNYFTRNHDWFYNNQVEFVIRTDKSFGRKATLAMSGGFSKFVKDYVEDSSNDKDELYKVAPFQISDGINEYGLAACYNVVPLDYGPNVVTPTEVQEEEIPALMLVRFIIDKFESATEAVNYIKKHCKIYFPPYLHDMGYELHIMVADSTKTYCLEFIENRTEIIDITSKPYMTNFNLYGVEYNADGSVYTPETQTETENAEDTNHITQYGSGLERFNLINSRYSSLTNMTTLSTLMSDLFYTKSYPSAMVHADPAWITEFVGNELTVKTPPIDFSDELQKASNAYLMRTRNTGLTWQTVHNALYDISNGLLYLRIQEDTSDTIAFNIITKF